MKRSRSCGDDSALCGRFPRCPLCLDARPQASETVHGRMLLDCPVCRLLYVHPAHHLDAERERAHYGLHQNHPSDAGYRRFLSRVAQPVLSRVVRGATGLDYGCGPGPTLSVMLEESGLKVHDYDPFFAPDVRALERDYDFVTCTEVVEHFSRPRLEFERLRRLLRPGGLLAVMTEVLQPDRDVATWGYARDPTHVCFYRWETFEWIAALLGAHLTRPHPNVALMELFK